jgi:integrase
LTDTLRWRDVDIEAARLQVRRSVGVVKSKGDGQQLVEGPTKTGQARVVDIDPDTVAAIEAYRAVRPAGRSPGAGQCPRPRQPDRRAPPPGALLPPLRRAGGPSPPGLGEDELPRIRLHDLRHTHATLLLAAGEPVKVVSERLGHANATITLTVYQHVHPGMGRQVTERYAALLRG